MPEKMERNKRTVLFQHLPGQTFDFGRTGVIARTHSIRGMPNTELNLKLVLGAIERAISPWSAEHRRLFPQPLESRVSSFLLVEPTAVSSEMFPLVFWCQNKSCGRVYSYTNQKDIPTSRKCPTCHKGRLHQLRFVRIHRCGALEPLEPYYCSKCHSSRYMALDTRGSERISGFKWICRKCNTTYGVFGRSCRQCDWETPVPNVYSPKAMSIQVHRAGKNFYPHYVTLLNQPGRELTAFLGIDEWPFIVAATFLDFEETQGQILLEYVRSLRHRQSANSSTLTDDQIQELKSRGFSDKQVADYLKMQEQLDNFESPTSPTQIPNLVVQRTGIQRDVWKRAGQELLEVVLPQQTADVRHVFGSKGHDSVEKTLVRKTGLDQLSLISDFPITTAIYGYSREDHRPDFCDVNPFPPDRNNNNKFPIYIDMIQADAIIARLDVERVWRWLDINNQSAKLPKGAGVEKLRKRAYFVDLFDVVQLRQTIKGDNPQAKMVFCLVHTLSHLFVRHAALLCGLERTSLAEYVLPRSLSFAVYSSHRFGATIGAMTALFEQSLVEWLSQIHNSYTCVYDPVCMEDGGNCHACTHLSEISCQFFNLNLGRVFLFGGGDPELGELVGYFEEF